MRWVIKFLKHIAFTKYKTCKSLINLIGVLRFPRERLNAGSKILLMVCKAEPGFTLIFLFCNNKSKKTSKYA